MLAFVFSRCLPVCAVLLFLLLPTEASAQQALFRHFGVEDHVPDSRIWWVTQDSSGFMWIGTEAGVARYDGRSFEVFTTADSLTGNSVFCIQQHSSGKLWMLPFMNQLCYFENGTFHRYSDTLGLASKVTNRMAEATDGALWISGYEDTYRLSEAGELARVDLPMLLDTPATTITHNLHPLSDGRMRILGRKGVVDAGPNRASTFYPFPDSLPRGFLNRSLQLSSGEFLVTINHTLYRFDDGDYVPLFSTGEWLPAESQINRLLEDRDGSIWIGTIDDGLLQFKSAAFDTPPERHLRGRAITCVTEDIEGNLWIGTYNDGLYFLPVNARHIRSYSRFGNQPNVQPTCVLVTSAGTRWIGYSNGTINAIAGADTSSYSLSDGGSDRQVRSLTEAPDGAVWALVSQGVARFFEGEMQVLPQFLGMKHVQEQPDGSLLLAQSNGFSILPQHAWHQLAAGIFPDSVFLKYRISTSRSALGLHASTGIYWIGTLNGVEAIDLGTKTLRRDLVPACTVVDLAEDAQQRLWIATSDRGVLVYDGETTVQIDVSMGLPANACKGLLLHPDGSCWVAVSPGLAHIVPQPDNPQVPFRVSSYFEYDGLPSGYINDLSLDENKLYVATTKGMAVIDINELPPYSPRPRVYITGVNINSVDTTVLPHYDLPHHQNDVRFSFRGLSYQSADAVSYQYELSNADHCVRTTQGPDITYPNLSPGEYEFKVFALNDDGLASVNPARVSLTIQKPYWTSWWFLTLVVLVLLATSFSIFTYRVMVVQREEGLRTQLLELEHRALHAQMNPHFIFNCLTSIQRLITLSDEDGATRYLSKFARLIRSILEQSRHQSVLLSEELKMLELYLEMESLRFKSGLQYTIDVAKDIPTGALELPSMLIQPYVENAVRHGLQHKEGVGHVRIAFVLENALLRCTVEDNGIGREHAASYKDSSNTNHESLGTKVTAERVDALNRSGYKGLSVRIEDLYENGNASGTRVHLTIPANYNF